MKKNLFLLIIVGLLSGCSQQDYNFKERGKKVSIVSKERFDEEHSRFVIKGYDNNDWHYDYLTLVLPNNFGEVNYIITLTNGIQAHKP